MADAPVPEINPCTFVVAWVGPCGKHTDNGRCTAHEDLVCGACGEPATHSCNYTGFGPLVCGAPLCAGCRHEPYDRKTAPFPSRHLTATEYRAAVKRIMQRDDESDGESDDEPDAC